MSRAGDLFVSVCNYFRIPVLLLCILLILLQTCAVDSFLIHHLAMEHYIWAIGDVIVLVLTIVCFCLTPKADARRGQNESGKSSIAWIVWFAMQSLLAAKIIVIFNNFSVHLEEEASFFSPNILRSSIALSSCIFVLLLISQHDSSPSSERRRYIEKLTGSIVFDILDTADILEVLFNEKERPNLSSGILELILIVATLNLLLPTIPLITLSKTKFGLTKPRKTLVHLHRVLLVLAVNVPNLIVRMLLWHGYDVAISPFTLKNILHIFLTFYEFYEHKKEKFEQHQREALELEERSVQIRGELVSNLQDGDEQTSLVEDRDENDMSKKQNGDGGMSGEEAAKTDTEESKDEVSNEKCEEETSVRLTVKD